MSGISRNFEAELEPSPRPLKRPRVLAACQRCKTWRQKRDNASPGCSNCTRAHVACTYSENAYPSAYVKLLEERVGTLEARLSAFDPSQSVDHLQDSLRESPLSKELSNPASGREPTTRPSSDRLASGLGLLSSCAAARYHIGYPVLARSVFGMYGQYFFVWIRAVVAIIWFSIQTYFGSQHLSVIFRCIFGNSWWDMPNHLPASAGINSRDLLAFFLFWLIELPFQTVHPTKIKYLFAAESIICPAACIGLCAWCVNYGGGIGVNSLGTNYVHGSALGWAMLNGMNSCLGVSSAPLVNQPDLTRYTRRPKDAGWRQASSIFASKTLIFFFGIGATAANQWDLLNAILDRFWHPAARAGCVFAAFGFALSVLGVNIGCNAIPFGADATGLLPKYFTIVRGQLFCGIVSLAIVPWKLLTNGSGFLTFLGSDNIFIAPICGSSSTISSSKRGNIHTLSLFNPSPGPLYYYAKGWSLKALACWVSAAVFGIPGLIGAYHPTWVICFAVASTLYFLINVALPPKVFPAGHEGAPKGFEKLAESEGYFDGEPTIRFRVVSTNGHEDHASRESSAVSISVIVGREKV